MIARTLLALFAIVNSAFATSDGVHASLDIAILEQAKDAYLDIILVFLNNLQLPDLDDGTGTDYLRKQHVRVMSDESDVIFSVDEANNALVLTLNNLNANYYCDWFRAKWSIFIATGHLEVLMNNVNLQLGLKFVTQTLPNGNVVPAVESVDVIVDIDKEDIDIKIWGNIWSTFASWFEVFFKSTVVDLINEGISASLNTVIPKVINAGLASTNGITEIPEVHNWALDWQTVLPAIVTATSFEIGARGIMFDELIGETEWATDFPTMSYKDTT